MVPFKPLSERTCSQLIIDKSIAANKTRSLSQWIIGLVVFGGEDPKTGLIVESAFTKGFSKINNIKAWDTVGAVPLSRKCLQSQKVRRSIGDGNNNQQALVHLIVEHNVIACNAMTSEGYNGDAMQIALKPTVLTVLNSQE